MIYSKQDILDALESGQLDIDPRPTDGMFSTSAVDLRLGDRFSVFAKPPTGAGIFVNLGEAQPEDVAARYGSLEAVASGEFLTLNPGDFVLTSTREYVIMPPHLAARVEGKSSLARFGLTIHQTAPTIHADFRGTIRLEISNVGPFVCRLTPGIPICQLVIEELKQAAREPLRSRFRGQTT